VIYVALLAVSAGWVVWHLQMQAARSRRPFQPERVRATVPTKEPWERPEGDLEPWKNESEPDPDTVADDSVPPPGPLSFFDSMRHRLLDRDKLAGTPCPKCRAGNRVRRGDHVRTHGFAPEKAPLAPLPGTAHFDAKTGAVWCEYHDQLYPRGYADFLAAEFAQWHVLLGPADKDEPAMGN
jgi:hypothetical protein